ncbi:hypothetical protein MTO96_000313 [Rhipicephalus appendiculatus]
MQFRYPVHHLWLVQVVAPLMYHRVSASAETSTNVSDAAWLTTSSPQATLGSVIRFTCSAPVSWAASFQWFVDDALVEADQFSPDRPFRVGLHHGEDRALMPEELAYTVLELHFSYNGVCGRQRNCVDGNSSCYVDLARQVRRCLCIRGYPFYSESRGSCLKHYTGLGSHCVTDLDCRDEPNTVCGAAGLCVCAPSYSGEYRLGECVREVGLTETCSAESMCSVEHSHCSANLTCQCYEGRRFDGSKCVPEVHSEGVRFRAAFFLLAAMFCLISLGVLVGTAVARVMCQLVPLRHGTPHTRQRRLVGPSATDRKDEETEVHISAQEDVVYVGDDVSFVCTVRASDASKTVVSWFMYDQDVTAEPFTVVKTQGAGNTYSSTLTIKKAQFNYTSMVRCKVRLDEDRCDDAHPVYSSLEVRCLELAKLEQPCVDSAQCAGADNGSQCEEHVCRCRAGFSAESGHCVAKPDASTCQSTSACLDGNAECVEGRCVCKAGYVLNPGSRKCEDSGEQEFQLAIIGVSAVAVLLVLSGVTAACYMINKRKEAAGTRY